MNKLSNSSKLGLLTRSITAICLVLVLFPVTLFGNWAFFVLFFLLAIVAIHEILSTPGLNRYNWFVKTVVYLFVLSFIYWAFLKNLLRSPDNPSYLNPFTNGGIFSLSDIFVSVTGITLYGLVLFTIAVVDPKVQLQDVTYLFTVGILLSLGFMGIYFVRFFPNSTGFVQNPNLSDLTVSVPFSNQAVVLKNYFRDYYQSYGYDQNLASSLLIFYICIGTWASDVGAYLFGMLFGKHKMNPRISPHKTWEGFFGGMATCIVVSLGLAAIMEFCFHLPLIPGLLQFSYSPALDRMGILHGVCWPFLILITLSFPIVGNIGGFLFSLIKRNYGIKDFGKVFPGHGGVIDRFDSIFTNCIVTTILLWITAYGWNFLI